MIDGQSYSLALGSSDAIPIPHLLSPHRSAACCARIRRGNETGWCHLPDQHDGEHEGTLSVPTTSENHGPRSKR